MNKYIGISRPLSVVRDRTSNLDAKYGPYNTINHAIIQLPEAIRRAGLTIGIITIKNGVETVDEYWWKEGTSDDHLVKKVTDGTVSKESITSALGFPVKEIVIISQSEYDVLLPHEQEGERLFFIKDELGKIFYKKQLIWDLP